MSFIYERVTSALESSHYDPSLFQGVDLEDLRHTTKAPCGEPVITDQSILDFARSVADAAREAQERSWRAHHLEDVDGEISSILEFGALSFLQDVVRDSMMAHVEAVAPEAAEKWEASFMLAEGQVDFGVYLSDIDDWVTRPSDPALGPCDLRGLLERCYGHAGRVALMEDLAARWAYWDEARVDAMAQGALPTAAVLDFESEDWSLLMDRVLMALDRVGLLHEDELAYLLDTYAVEPTPAP